MLAWLCQQPDLEQDLKFLTVFISWVLREQGFGGRGLFWFVLAQADSLWFCKTWVRESTRELTPNQPLWKKHRSLFCLFLGLSFLLVFNHGQERGWNLSSEIACEILPAKLWTAGLAWTYYWPRFLQMLPATVWTEISLQLFLQCKVLKPLKLIVTFIHPPSCQLRGVCKVRKIINHLWSAAIPGFSGKIAVWPSNHIVRVSTSVTAIKLNQKNCFNRNTTLHI